MLMLLFLSWLPAAQAGSTSLSAGALDAAWGAADGDVWLIGQLEQDTDTPLSIAAAGGATVSGAVWRAGLQARYAVLGDFDRKAYVGLEGRYRSDVAWQPGVSVGGKYTLPVGLMAEAEAGVLLKSAGGFGAEPLLKLNVGWSF